MCIRDRITTLPLVIFYFHQYSFLSIVANLVILPFSEIIIIFSLLMTILYAFQIEFLGLSSVYEKIGEILLNAIHFFAAQDRFSVKNIPLSLSETVIILIAIYYLRFVLKKFEYQSFIKFSGVFLIFFGVRIVMNWYYFEKSEILTVHYFKQKVFLIKDKQKAIFWVEKNANKDKVFKFIVESYLTSRRIEEFEIKELPDDAYSVRINDKVFKIE